MKEKILEKIHYYFVVQRMKTLYAIAIVLFMITVFKISLFSDIDKSQEEVLNTVKYDLPDILKDGKLTILAENSSTSFFIYRGRKMGFEYEILKEFANEIGVELEIKIVDNLDDLNELLAEGEGDLIACNYTITKERSKLIDFSVPIIRSNQVLIQRKPKGWEKMMPDQIRLNILHDPSQLAEKEIYVWKQSSYYERLINLQEEIGDSIYIKAKDGQMGAEELIEMVSEGMIDYTVAEENVAKLNSSFYDNIDYSLSLSVKQKIAFGLRKSSPLLKAKLDKWLEEYMRKTTFKYIQHKYFEMAHVTTTSDLALSSLKGGQISHYDVYFKAAANKYGWDWRMLASVAYQESKFDPAAVSFGGAYSIMQFMPETGSTYSVYPSSPPNVQIMGGMHKLSDDYNFWNSVPDKIQRQKFALASYNAGRSHIEDAQRLAEKYGKNPLVWDGNVEEMALNLSRSEYYRDPLVESGAMRGTITVRYVREIYSRYLMWISIYH
ncbi:MAG: transporter substrate-binding domain-containing protein [Flavobacteriia bacterium]|nr:transporter substrate-binding domain-containing protein [Flavobacteriia bacterium]